MDFSNTIGPSHKRKCKRGLLPIQCIFVLVFIPGLCHSFSVKVSDYSVDMTCENDTQCTEPPWIEPYPSCYLGQCVCFNSCIHYTLDSKGWSRHFCGECGTIGSECSSKVPCQYPADDCTRLGYCSCPVGYIYEDICVHYQPVTTSKESISLIVTLVFILVIYKFVSTLKWLKKMFRRCFSCSCCSDFCSRDDDTDEETVYGYNPESRNKSAAYTISSSEFMSTYEDTDLEWALQLSSIFASNLSNSEDTFVPNSYIQRRPPLRRNRNRNRREGERSLQGADASLSSSSSHSSNFRNRREGESFLEGTATETASLSSSSPHSSSFTRECADNASACTISADPAAIVPPPTISTTGTIQRTRSIPASLIRRRANTHVFTRSAERDCLNVNRNTERNSSTTSSTSDEFATSEETSNVHTFRRVNSIPRTYTRNQTLKYMPLSNNSESVNAKSFGSSGVGPEITTSMVMRSDSIYSSAVSNLSRDSRESRDPCESTRSKISNIEETFYESMGSHSRNKNTKLETLRKDVSIPLADILRETLSVDSFIHCEDNMDVNGETETIL